MKIGLIADTHVPTVADRIPAEVFDVFKDVDMVLHAGDIQMARALDELESLGPVYAARGNNDYFFEDPRMQPVQMLKVNGLTIACIHVFEYPHTAWSYYHKQHFNREPVDVVVYGDTHVPEVVREDGLLMVNPGSPTSPGPHMSIGLGHVALLDVSEGQVEATVVDLREL